MRNMFWQPKRIMCRDNLFSTNLCATNIETREDAIQSSIVVALLCHPLLCCKGTVAETKEGTILYRGHCLVASVAMSNRTQEALGEGLEPDIEWTCVTVSIIGNTILVSTLRLVGNRLAVLLVHLEGLKPDVGHWCCTCGNGMWRWVVSRSAD